MMDDSDSTAVWILRHTSDAKSSDKVKNNNKNKVNNILIFIFINS